MNGHAHFLTAIQASPADDLPRLVYADWLDENGQPERAELIRVGCELARRRLPRMVGGEATHRCFVCRSLWRSTGLFQAPAWMRCSAGSPGCCDPRPLELNAVPLSDDERRLLTRELELVALHDGERPACPRCTTRYAAITADAPCGVCGGVGRIGEFRRGFIAEVRCRLGDWIGAACELCRGLGIVDEVGETDEEDGVCPDCSGTGQRDDIGPQVMAEHPVEHLEISDLKPRPNGHRAWVVDRDMLNRRDAVWNYLQANVLQLSRTFPSEQEAIAATVAALIKWAKTTDPPASR